MHLVLSVSRIYVVIVYTDMYIIPIDSVDGGRAKAHIRNLCKVPTREAKHVMAKGPRRGGNRWFHGCVAMHRYVF